MANKPVSAMKAQSATQHPAVTDSRERSHTFERPAHIARLQLTNFRSYHRAELRFDGRPVCFSGANGSGKTNILEALSLLAPGRGLRSAKLSELWCIEGDGSWAVSVRLMQDGDATILGVGSLAETPDRRVCRVDGNSASGPSAFQDYLRFIWLTPAQDRLFVEGASDRRRFFDRMVATQDREFTGFANTYERAMRQRQTLLEEGGRDDRWLSSLEQQMSEAGVAMADARRRMAITLVSQEVVGDDSLFPKADISLEGHLEAALDAATRDGVPAADVEYEFAERLKHQRTADREARRALFGPHRSDLIVGHRAKARPARLCSTGEQKGLLIGLVLAHARSLSSKTGTAPPLVLLLDEIGAHLDHDRRACLFDILEGLGLQAFMTGTDVSLFDGWADRAQHFTVSGSTDGTQVEETGSQGDPMRLVS